MIKYRLFEWKDGKYLTLFHGINGSRVVPVGKWIKAKQSIVYEGQHGKRYRAGFHIFKSLSMIPIFINKFKAHRALAVVRVEIRGNIRNKPSNPNIFLAPEMKLLSRRPELIFHI